MPMDKEEKKHIWYMIICMLLSNLVLFFVTETLLLLYILLWTKSCCDYFLLMEWLNKQYVTANYALNSIDRYMCDHLIDIMCAQHQLPMPLVAVNDGTCTYQYYSVHNLL